MFDGQGLAFAELVRSYKHLLVGLCLNPPDRLVRLTGLVVTMRDTMHERTSLGDTVE